MSVNNITNVGQTVNTRAGHALQFDAGDVLSDRLRIGEIVLGKVTKHFDGRRYSVNFAGIEKVVDSEIPLTRGELLYGRVVGVNEKVHLQRVYPKQTQEPKAVYPRSENQALLQNLFTKHQVELTPKIQAQILSLMKAQPSPVLIAFSCLVLSKLGLRSEPMLVRAVSKVLAGERNVLDERALRVAPALDKGGDWVSKTDPLLISELASMLSILSKPRSGQASQDVTSERELSVSDKMQGDVLAEEHESGGDQGEESSNNDEMLGQWILNAQNGGSVSHRLSRLPVWFGNQLIEVDVVLFSQRDTTMKPEGVRYHKIVLSLQIEELGHVEACVFAADHRISLHFTTDNERSSNIMAGYYGEIKKIIQDLGWELDEVNYSTRLNLPDGVMQSVVDHYITSDSLSRVM